MNLTPRQKLLLKKYLRFMAGFEESTLYIDYMTAEDDFADRDYQDALTLISQIAEGK